MNLPWDDVELLIVEEMCEDLLLWYSFSISATSWGHCRFCERFRTVPPRPPDVDIVPNLTFHNVYNPANLVYCASCPWVVFEGVTCTKFAFNEKFWPDGVSAMRTNRVPIEWVERRCVMLRSWLRRIDMAQVVRKKLEGK